MYGMLNPGKNEKKKKKKIGRPAAQKRSVTHQINGAFTQPCLHARVNQLIFFLFFIFKIQT
jgi:hypothetical protein